MSEGSGDQAFEEFAFDVFASRCPSRSAMEHLTGRWGVFAVAALHAGPARFNALRRRVDGISEKMLSQTLQALERDGFVHRDARPTNPPHVEYRLTALGEQVADRLLGLIELLESRMPEVLEARDSYDEKRAEAPAR